MGGSNVVGKKGTYGTQGTAAAGDVPGARSAAVSWTDAAGNFWLFGGAGLDSAGMPGLLNDLWKYKAGQWTWMGGSKVVDQQGTYGTQGTAGAGNFPGARSGAGHWIDAGGNFWLFGGFGFDSAGAWGNLNDVWKYSGGQWTWMGGSNVADQTGAYGTQGAAAAGNVPGARSTAITWTDGAGNFWLFGGFGCDSAGTQGFLNDLWKYGGGQWTWMGGSNVVNQEGKYGTQGTAAASNIPGARDVAVAWTDAAGNFWFFGGYGYDSAGTAGLLNDLWKYEP
jgi:N-acetylneuraminic acid mutarotase